MKCGLDFSLENKCTGWIYERPSVNNNVTDFWIILAIALGATVCGLTPAGS